MTIEQIMENVRKEVSGLNQIIDGKQTVAQYLTTLNRLILESGVFDLSLALDGLTGTFEGKEIVAKPLISTGFTIPTQKQRDDTLRNNGLDIDAEIMDYIKQDLISELSMAGLRNNLHVYVPISSEGIVKEDGEDKIKFFTTIGVSNLEISKETMSMNDDNTGDEEFVGDVHSNCMKRLETIIANVKDADRIIVSPTTLTIMQSAAICGYVRRASDMFDNPYGLTHVGTYGGIPVLVNQFGSDYDPIIVRNKRQAVEFKITDITFF